MSAVPESQVFHGSFFVGLIEPLGGSWLFTKLPLRQKPEVCFLSQHPLSLLSSFEWLFIIPATLGTHDPPKTKHADALKCPRSGPNGHCGHFFLPRVFSGWLLFRGKDILSFFGHESKAITLPVKSNVLVILPETPCGWTWSPLNIS